MKHAAWILTAVALAAIAVPARTVAQLPGMPVWNSPKGGTGLTVAGDVGFPDSVGGKGTTCAARVVLGLQALSVGATVGVRNPSGTGPNVTEYGGTLAYRLIGGSLIPLSVNLQGGYAGYSRASTNYSHATAAIGFAIDLPTPGVTVEPWVAPGVRINHAGASGAIASQTNTAFGVAGGLTIGMGMMGLHAAMDYEGVKGGGHATTLGIGVHLAIRPSFGL
jgi:hypothetical protein